MYQQLLWQPYLTVLMQNRVHIFLRIIFLVVSIMFWVGHRCDQGSPSSHRRVPREGSTLSATHPLREIPIHSTRWWLGLSFNECYPPWPCGRRRKAVPPSQHVSLQFATPRWQRTISESKTEGGMLEEMQKNTLLSCKNRQICSLKWHIEGFYFFSFIQTDILFQ